MGIIGMILFMALSPLYAIGVKAATIISNQATLSYEIEDESFVIVSNQTQDIVDQLINLELNWLNSSDIGVKRSEKEATLNFKITNSGNGEDSFNLFILTSMENNFQLYNCKTLINKNIAKNSITLQADDSSLIDVSCDIEDSDIRNDTPLEITLKAVSIRGGSGVSGTLHKSKGVQGVDAIDGIKGGVDSADARFIFKSKEGLKLKKSYIVDDLIVTYKITLSLAKNRSAQNIVLSDEIPKFTEYVNGSLKLDGKTLSDSIDHDQGRFDILKNSIFVDIDTLRYPNKKVIEFSVKIK